jgi:hypothetical protein
MWRLCGDEASAKQPKVYANLYTVAFELPSNLITKCTFGTLRSLATIQICDRFRLQVAA